MNCLSCSNCHSRPRTMAGYLTGGTVSRQPIWPPMSASTTMSRNQFKPFAGYPFPHPQLARGIMRTRALGHFYSNNPAGPRRSMGALGASPTPNYSVIGGVVGALGILMGSAPLMAAGTLVGSFSISQGSQTIPQEASKVNMLPGMTTSIPYRG